MQRAFRLLTLSAVTAASSAVASAETCAAAEGCGFIVEDAAAFFQAHTLNAKLSEEPSARDPRLLDAEAENAFVDTPDGVGLASRAAGTGPWIGKTEPRTGVPWEDFAWSPKTSKPIVEEYKGKCQRFIILTMQRSGSTWASHEVNNMTHTRMTFEALSLFPKQSGGMLQEYMNLTREEIVDMGAINWANRVFNSVTYNWAMLGKTLAPPCAVGFKIMTTNSVFPREEYYELLLQKDIKKIILRRNNTRDQWFSMQRACFVGKWGGKGEEGYMESVNETQERISNGERCGPRGIARRPKFFTKVHNQFKFYRVISQGAQLFEVTTEQLTAKWPLVTDFLLKDSLAT